MREAKADQIKYGVASNERVKVEHLKKVLCLPMEMIPDPRTMIEDKKDQEKQQRDAEARAQRLEEERQAKKAAAMVKRENLRKNIEAKQKQLADGGEEEEEDEMSESGSDDGASQSRSRAKDTASAHSGRGSQGTHGRQRSSKRGSDSGSRPGRSGS